MSSGRATYLFLGLSLLCATVGLSQLRRLFIRSWFVQGIASEPRSAGAPPTAELSAAASDAASQPAADPLLRVVLVDGLGSAQARRLKSFPRLCQAGVNLNLGVGFPSVSLPVQHLLWTGAWQSESGVMFQVKRLPAPVFQSLPELLRQRGKEAVAVAEKHGYIVRSFPFSSVRAPSSGAFSTEQLREESLQAWRSAAALVFVHILRVDKAGHDHGAGSAEYLRAADEADRLVGQLYSERPARATMVVLSDHGHLVRLGGHGGLEPEIAQVQACLAGPGLRAGQRGDGVLPDLTRIMADLLQLPPPSRCAGRSLSAVLAGQAPHLQPLPHRTPLLVSLAVTGTLLLLALGLWKTPALLLIPWGLLAAATAMLLLHGSPTLSHYYVYRALPVGLWPAVLIAAAASGALVVLPLRRRPPPGAVLLQAFSCLLPALVATVAAGWPWSLPPLVPSVTAWASVLGLLCQGCWLGLGLAALLSSLRASCEA